MSTGDNGFVLICAAFVFFMTPGLAFFYGGLVRRKNIVNTIMACVGIMGLSVVMWSICASMVWTLMKHCPMRRRCRRSRMLFSR